MRILQVIPSIDGGQGGPTTAALALNRELRRLGHDVILISTRPHTSEPGVAEGPPLPTGFRLKPPVWHLGNHGLGFGITTEIWRTASWADVLYIHGAYSYSSLVALAAGRALRRPVALQAHGSLQAGPSRHTAVKRGYDWAIGRWLVQGARLVVFASGKEQAESRVKLRRAMKVVVPLGADHVADGLPARVEQISRARYTLLFLGRLDPVKRIDLVLAAMGMLPPEDRPFLIVVGPDPVGLRMELSQLAHALGLQDYVEFREAVPARGRGEVFTVADAAVLPSQSENFGIAAVEALFAGRPVIVSSGVGMQEFVTDREVIRIFPAGDAKLLAEEILKLRAWIGSTDEQDIRRRCWSAARRHFSWDSTAREIEGLLGDLCGREV